MNRGGLNGHRWPNQALFSLRFGRAAVVLTDADGKVSAEVIEEKGI